MRQSDYQWQTTNDGTVVECWDSETPLLVIECRERIPLTSAVKQMLIDAYARGLEDGKHKGRVEVQFGIRRLLRIDDLL